MPRRKSDSKASEASKVSKTDGPSKSEPVNLLANQSSKWKNMTVRAFWTFVMIFGFLLTVAMGHLFVILTVLLIQTLVFKEVIALASAPKNEDRKLPWSRTLNWYFLASTTYFLYGESLIYYFKEIMVVDAFLRPLAYHHRLISFTLYCIGEF